MEQRSLWIGADPKGSLAVRLTSFISKRFSPLLLSVLAALLNVLIFPQFDVSWLAFLCFVPLFVLIPFLRAGTLFWYSMLAGFLFHIGNLYWIVHVIQHYTNLNTLLSVGIVLLLCFVLALLWGIFGALLGIYSSKGGFETAMLVAPFLWIVLEWVRNLLQFPWCLVGYSQYNHLRIAQLAGLTGVYGLSWLVLAVNAAFSLFVVRGKKFYLIIVAVILVAVVGFGHYRIRKDIDGPSLRVGCVQGNIPQDVKIIYEFAEHVNRKHLQMTRELIESQHPDIVFWTEASTLYPIQEGGDWSQEVFDLAKDMGTPLVIGSDAYVGKEVFNSAFLINENGEIAGEYDKIYLVPFGEYVPLKRLFFFAGKVVPEISDFSAGKNHLLFSLKGGKFAVNICFEVIFPQLSRKFSKQGAALLTTITNDAWFGKTSAPYQHFAMAVMRAIENKRYLVRAANTGISGIVDPYGRILTKTDIFVDAKFAGSVQWITEQTFYTKYGDLIVYLALLVCAVIFSPLSFVLRRRVMLWRLRQKPGLRTKDQPRILEI